MLSPEARHLVKIADLDGLEAIARGSDDRAFVSGDFEEIFEALDRRTQIDEQTVLAWGERYIAWARATEREGIIIIGTAWARRVVEIALPLQRRELALAAIQVVLDSYAPLEKERRWWQKQRYELLKEPGQEE